jgi:hypothetical protein
MLLRADLTPHPLNPPKAIREVQVEVDLSQSGLVTLWYTVFGDISELVVPEEQSPARVDGLWETTCFELFVSAAGSSYREFNFSPSSQWAAYAFSGPREGVEPFAIDHDPIISFAQPNMCFELHVTLPDNLVAGDRIGLSAVVEERDGRKSYWALRHPAGDADFHHPDCFALEVPAAGKS